MRTNGQDRGGAPRVLAVSGSLRAGSSNTQLLRAAEALGAGKIQMRLWDGLAALPPFSEDDEGQPGHAVHALRKAIVDADALLISTPEYNFSIPGQLKNAVDWASRPYGEGALTGKSVAVVGASPSDHGAAWAQADLRKSLGAAGAAVLDRELCVVKAHEAFGPEGRLLDHELERGLSDILDELARVPEPVGATA